MTQEWKHLTTPTTPVNVRQETEAADTGPLGQSGFSFCRN